METWHPASPAKASINAKVLKPMSQTPRLLARSKFGPLGFANSVEISRGNPESVCGGLGAQELDGDLEEDAGSNNGVPLCFARSNFNQVPAHKLTT